MSSITTALHAHRAADRFKSFKENKGTYDDRNPSPPPSSSIYSDESDYYTPTESSSYLDSYSSSEDDYNATSTRDAVSAAYASTMGQKGYNNQLSSLRSTVTAYRAIDKFKNYGRNNKNTNSSIPSNTTATTSSRIDSSITTSENRSYSNSHLTSMKSTARAYRAIDKFRSYGRNNNNKDHDRNKEAKKDNYKKPRKRYSTSMTAEDLAYRRSNIKSMSGIHSVLRAKDKFKQLNSNNNRAKSAFANRKKKEVISKKDWKTLQKIINPRVKASIISGHNSFYLDTKRSGRYKPLDTFHVDISKASLQGWLLNISLNRTSITKKKRWFVLIDHYLLYFSSQVDSLNAYMKPLAIIPLLNCSILPFFKEENAAYQTTSA